MKKNNIFFYLIVFLFLIFSNLTTFANINKICFDGVDESFNCLNWKEKTVTDYFNELNFNYTNWVFNQWIDFRTWKVSKTLSSYKAWTIYSYSIWADFSNKSTSSISTLIARNWWTYHHLLIDNTGDSGQQYLAVYNGAWFKSNFSTKDLTGWQNIIVVVDPSEATEKTKFYLNWSYVWFVNTAINSDTYPISIIWNVSTTWNQNSMPLDEFWLWNRKLDSSEISQLQNSLASSISNWLIYRDSFDNIENWISYNINSWFNIIEEVPLRSFNYENEFYNNNVGFSEIESVFIRDFSSIDSNPITNGYNDTGEINLRSFQEELNNNSVINGYNETEVTINNELFKDLFFNFNSNYLIYLARGIEESNTISWYKKILICWQENSLINTKSFNCRHYFTNKNTIGDVSSRLLEFQLPTINSIEEFKMNLSSFSLIQNKLCFKDTNVCLNFDFNKGDVFLSKTNANEIIKSNSTYFNNQIAYIKSDWFLNLSNKVYLKEPYDSTKKIFLYGIWNKLLLQEWTELRVYDENLNELSINPWIVIKDIISKDNVAYFSNNLDKDKLYVLNWEDGIISKKDFRIDIQSKLFIENKNLFFSSNKIIYRLNLESDTLYKKEGLINWDSEGMYLFPINRENWKKEFIIFNN